MQRGVGHGRPLSHQEPNNSQFPTKQKQDPSSRADSILLGIRFPQMSDREHEEIRERYRNGPGCPTYGSSGGRGTATRGRGQGT